MTPKTITKIARAARKAHEARKARLAAGTNAARGASITKQTIAQALIDRETAYKAWREARETVIAAERRVQTNLAHTTRRGASATDRMTLIEAEKEVIASTRSADNAYEAYKAARARFNRATIDVAPAEREAALAAWNQIRNTLKTKKLQAAETAVAFTQVEQEAAVATLQKARETLGTAEKNAAALRKVIHPNASIVEQTELALAEKRLEIATQAVNEAEEAHVLKHHLHYNAKVRLDLARTDAAVAEQGMIGDLEIAAGTERDALVNEAALAIERAGVSRQVEANQAVARALAERNAANEAWSQARDAVRTARTNLKNARANGNANAIQAAQAEFEVAEKAAERAKAVYNGKTLNHKTALKIAAEAGVAAFVVLPGEASASESGQKLSDDTSESKPYPITSTAFGAAITAVDIGTEGAAYAVDGWVYGMTGGTVSEAGHTVLAVEDAIVENVITPILTSETAAPMVEPVFDALETSANAMDSSIAAAVNPVIKYVIKPGVSGINQALIEPSVNAARAIDSTVKDAVNSVTSLPVAQKINPGDDAVMNSALAQDRRFVSYSYIPDQKPVAPNKNATVWAAAAGENQSVESNFTPVVSESPADNEICEENINSDPNIISVFTPSATTIRP